MITVTANTSSEATIDLSNESLGTGAAPEPANERSVPPWVPHFRVCIPALGEGPPHCNGEIRLRQTGANSFTLDSDVEYVGDYRHADGRELDESWRNVGVGFETDLASIPPFMRWLVNTYGAHTPAALIHDKLIPQGNLQGDVEADRFFRHMLAEVGVPFVTRWISWGGVAVRTRAMNGLIARLTLVVWVASAIAGLAMTAFGLATGSSTWIAVAFVPMIPATLAWGRQWGVGLIAALSLPFIIPVLLLIGVAIGVGWILNLFAEGS